MIYILTGIAKSGKTLLSNEIKERYKIANFSTDYIMMMLYRGNEKLGIDVTASDRSVANKIEPYVYGMIKTMIENGDTYLIEGVHFNPDFSRKLLDEFKENIKILYLGYKDITQEKKLEEVMQHKNSMNNPWLFNMPNQTVEETITYLIAESKRVCEDCSKYGLSYIDIFDINQQKEDIINLLMDK